MDDDDAKSGFAGGQAGAFASVAEANAAHEVRIGMEAFRTVADALQNVDYGKSKGNLFEYIEAARFNENAALRGSGARAQVTASIGRPTDPADLEIIDGARILERIQAKVSRKPQYMAHTLKNPKYEGMQRLVPSDAEARVRELTDSRAASKSIYAEQYAESAENLSGELKHQDISSGGTSRAELKDAHSNPDSFGMKADAAAVGRQAAKAGAAGAAVGGGISIALETVRQGYRFHKGDTDGRTAVIAVTRAGVRGGVRGGASGAGGAVISHVAAKAGLKSIAKTNIATTIAASTIDAGVAVFAYTKGEIDEYELGERLGNNGVSTMSSLYVGAAAGAVFGPPGMLIGSVAGYMVASDTFQATMAILRETRLTKAETARIERLADDCIRAMQVQQAEIESLIEKTDARREVWETLVDEYDSALATANHERLVELSTHLTCFVGVELQFESFEEFDGFMSDPDSGPLVI